MSRRRIPLAILLLSAASTAFAQEEVERARYSPPPPGRTSTGGRPLPPPPDFAKTRGVLKVGGTEIKTKDALYPDETALVGRSPAAAHASLGLEVRAKKLETVDQEELRRRTLSLYGDSSDSATAGRGRSARSGRGGTTEGSGSALAAWLLGGAAIAALAGWRFRKSRKLPVTD